MTTDEIRTTVVNYIAFTVGIEPVEVGWDTSLLDIGVDSLAAIEISNFIYRECIKFNAFTH